MQANSPRCEVSGSAAENLGAQSIFFVAPGYQPWFWFGFCLLLTICYLWPTTVQQPGATHYPWNSPATPLALIHRPFWIAIHCGVPKASNMVYLCQTLKLCFWMNKIHELFHDKIDFRLLPFQLVTAVYTLWFKIFWFKSFHTSLIFIFLCLGLW